ncbi:hypothetical protein AGABI1DRAFT_128536 [Agaricus bisporus var. burnettii JB137-S8]|uniref:MATH domain-containing protein n=1 Tax=Agaricus bisporus var. burnettii (strain JB137-S8 / ATCC MYA-4627 / FGSC 10392) TaxID=597362 RepID=K5X8P3_AGABU|nr:uncharacterized protein AGABI1DRAFT_128536 [Agaricus bisporus var. burnettii JB137-S8]EKM79382.1 hypothetical protein AGABI1DRAFT_128536 [Agaricus bisporus var. burnettii JB137-S8]
MDQQDSNCSESSALTFEWPIRNLKLLFDSTKGDTKSKALKSPKFGGGRWQILFYANAGTSKETSGSESSGYVSLFLACEPTVGEKEAALKDSGRWVREGVYKFCFELRKQNILHNLKEASNHTFSYKTANWGWAQFARRDSVYYQSISAKSQDAFVIVCTITSTSSPTTLLPSGSNLSVPKTLIDTVGSLLDDPLYSDVEFVIMRHTRNSQNARRIWASRKMLQRAEHFNDMLGTNFAEGTMDNALRTPRPAKQALANSSSQSENGIYSEEYIDSDDEDDYSDGSDDDDDDVSSQMDTTDNEFAHVLGPQDDDPCLLPEVNVQDEGGNQPSLDSQSTLHSVSSLGFSAADGGGLVRQKNKSHLTVVIKDVAYNTYRALLYYLYTDNIVFAPLASSFNSSRLAMSSLTRPSPSSPSTEAPPAAAKKGVYTDSATSRKDWIKEWMKHNQGRPAPCSAKAIYREADRLDLRDLKARAAQHIFKSLTVENIAYEVFSPFASTFEEIRKVEIEFFLKHWQEIRTSDAMKNVWQQIRIGRHPGFEEVWPAIAMNLEFRPDSPKLSSPSGNDAPGPMVT